MRDDVVQLAGDPGALGGHGHLGLGLALVLQALVPLDELGVVGPAGAQRVAQYPGEGEGDHGEEREEDVVAEVPLVHLEAQGVQGGGEESDGERGTGHPARDLGRGGDRVQDDQHREVGVVHLGMGDQLVDAGADGHPEHRLRPLAAQGHHEAHRDHRGHGEHPGGGAAETVVGDLQHPDPEEEDSPEAVDARRVSAEEVVEALHVTQSRERR